jgi:hypothetical protein
MEADNMALAHIFEKLFQSWIWSLCWAKVGLPVSKATMDISIQEDSAGALVFVETLPPQLTPRSKHYAIKMIWFSEQIVQRNI